MKITVCDVCNKQDKKIVEAERVIRVRKHANLNIDVCNNHSEEVNKMPMPDYVRFVYKLEGITLTETDSEIKEKFLRNW